LKNIDAIAIESAIKPPSNYDMGAGLYFARLDFALRALTMQTLSWSLKLFITSNNVDLESK